MCCIFNNNLTISVHGQHSHRGLQIDGVAAHAQRIYLLAHVDELRLHGQIPFKLPAFAQLFRTHQPAGSLAILRGHAEGPVTPGTRQVWDGAPGEAALGDVLPFVGPGM